MKNKNNDSDAPVTKGMLDEAVEKIGTKISAKIDEKVDSAIGDLAIMVEKGFQAMTKQMDSKFEQVDRRFEQVDKRFEKIDSRFEQIDRKFKKVDGHFEKVFSEFKDVHKEIGVNKLKTQGDIAGLDFRAGKLEKKIEA